MFDEISFLKQEYHMYFDFIILVILKDKFSLLCQQGSIV